MPWVPPTTVTNGTQVSETIWNQQIRDNLNFLHSPPMIIAARSVNQNIGPGANTLIDFDTQVFDNVNGFTPTSTTLTTNQTGYYSIVFTITCINAFFSPINNAEFTVLKNNVQLDGGFFKSPNDSFAVTTSTTEWLIAEVASGDTISLLAFFEPNLPTNADVTAQLSMVFIGES